MSKGTTDQKTEKQTETETPVVMKDIELDAVSGGVSGEIYFQGQYIISLSSADTKR